jgi:hypothetical protein
MSQKFRVELRESASRAFGVHKIYPKNFNRFMFTHFDYSILLNPSQARKNTIYLSVS